MGTQTNLDVTQACPLCQLGERHAHVLVSTRGPFNLVFALVAMDTRCDLLPRKKIHELCTNRLPVVHSSHHPILHKKYTNLRPPNSNLAPSLNLVSICHSARYNTWSLEPPESSENSISTEMLDFSISSNYVMNKIHLQYQLLD